MTLPTDYKARKSFPLLTFLTAYFPDTIEALVALSKQGNIQHEVDANAKSPFILPGDQIAWDRSKSTDECETAMRHLWDHMRGKRSESPLNLYDTDGVLHCVKHAWRAMAEAQKTLESEAKRTRGREVDVAHEEAVRSSFQRSPGHLPI